MPSAAAYTVNKYNNYFLMNMAYFLKKSPMLYNYGILSQKSHKNVVEYKYC